MKLVAFALFLTLALFGQEPTHTVFTVPPANARFQIVQSEMTAKGTFKLDRFTGRVWQLLGTPEGNIWSAMVVQGIGVKGVESTAPRYQLFTSGLAYKFTYLLDTLNGTYWELVGSESSNDSWQLVLNNP